MKPKIFLFVILLFWALSPFAFAETVKTTVVQKDASSSFQSQFANGMSIGYVREGTQEVGILSWRPDFKWGYFGLGFNLNLPLGDQRPTGYEPLVFRYVEYDDYLRGLRYGVLSDVTLGSGLLMNKYSTLGNVSVLLNSTQLGVKAYCTFEDVFSWENLQLWGMRTYSNLYAVRISEKIYPWLTLGQSYVWDTDGVSLKKSNGAWVSYPAQSGFELDLFIPLVWDADYYAEFAKLTDHGAGAATGVRWVKDVFIANFSLNLGLRYLEKNFAPGYFNEGYETDPIDLASVEASGVARGGYFVDLSGQALGFVGGDLALESYGDSKGTFDAELWANFPLGIFVSGYYQQQSFTDFRSLSLEEGAIAGGKLAYPLNPYTTIVANYKKMYNKSTGQIEESRYYEFQLAF